MADSPAPSPDGSYGTYPSSRDSTPQPGITNCGFVPIDLPNGNQQLGNAQIAMSDPNIGHPRCQGQPEIGEYSQATTTTSGGTRFNMADANISAPQIKWSTGSDGMSFTFTGVSNSGTMTSTSECSYASSTDDFDDQRSGCSETSKSKAKPKRKRIITKDQRRAANQRERRRMVTLNDAFDMLKQRIPTFTHEKKLSRIETLRLAISYISFMGQLVDGKHPSDVTINLPYPKSDDDQQGHGNLSDVMENYGYVMHDSMAPEPMVAMDANGYVMDMNQQHHQQGYYTNGGFMTQ